MPVKILADENVDFRIVRYLRSLDFNVISISENFAGVTDEEVLKIAGKENAVLLTEDKDFGEWVFAHKIKTISIILLRYNVSELNDIMPLLNGFIEKHEDSLFNKFIVIKKKSIRIREI